MTALRCSMCQNTFHLFGMADYGLDIVCPSCIRSNIMYSLRDYIKDCKHLSDMSLSESVDLLQLMWSRDLTDN